MTEPNFFSDLVDELHGIWLSTGQFLSGTGIRFRNSVRRLRRLETDYIVITLGGKLPERAGPPRSFIQRRLPLPPEPLSIELLNRRFQSIADASNVRGVVLVFEDITAGLARLQSLRLAIERLQKSGKEIVVFTPYLDLRHYFLATAAHRIICPPSASFEVLGIQAQAYYLKDVLHRFGLKAEVIQVSPYKSAFDALARNTMSLEEKEQLNWLLDDIFEQLTNMMADSRSIQVEHLKTLIDGSPMSAEQAKAEGLIDDVCYEDFLPHLLATDGSERSNDGDKPAEGEKEAKARLLGWEEGRGILLEKHRRKSRRYVAVLNIEGDIVMGPSQKPPVNLPIPIPFASGQTAGEQTIIGQIRRLEKSQHLAAIVVHINSPGGSALASDLIWRELARVAKKIPLITYMGDVAASGGYYTGAPARHIIAQPLTITGSIGVVSLHLSTKGLFEMLDVNRVVLKRGKRALLYSDVDDLTDDQRQVLNERLQEAYSQFKQVVAEGRDLVYSDLDPICEGRVWTGRQALAQKLVDSHGDFLAAVDRAKELAELSLSDDHYVPVVNIYSGDGHQVPVAYDPVEMLMHTLAFASVRKYAGQPLYLMPFELTFG